MTGHSAHDAAHYVPKGLFDEWGKLDPIIRLEARMLQESWAGREEIEACHAGVRKEVDEAVRWADASPVPDPATLLDDVYESQ
jgi:pyruvate dehydrogenase E1 component alpha subunit